MLRNVRRRVCRGRCFFNLRLNLETSNCYEADSIFGKKGQWVLQRMLVIGWWVFGFLFVFGNLHRIGDPLPPIVLISYPIGIVIGGIVWTGVYQGIGWFCVRVWRFFAKESERKNAKSIREIKEFGLALFSEASPLRLYMRCNNSDTPR